MGATAHFGILDQSRLAYLRSIPESLEEYLFESEIEPFLMVFDIDKSWHGLHFLLTKKLEADGSVLGDAILGGEHIGNDLGYGRARLIDVKRVLEIQNALKEQVFEELVAKVDAGSPLIEKIFFVKTFEPRIHPYLKHYFLRLQECYFSAAMGRHAILTYLA
jgi:hypothetical protein